MSDQLEPAMAEPKESGGGQTESALGSSLRPTTKRRLLWILIVAGLAVATGIAILVAVNSRPSLQDVARECGGPSSGIAADPSGIVVTTTSGLTCVTSKVFPDRADQYAIALFSDEGGTGSMVIDGRTIKVGSLAGGRFVFIGDK